MATANYKQHNTEQFSFEGSIGYKFVPNVYAFAKYERKYGLYEENEIRTHFSSHLLGGGLGVNLYKINTSYGKSFLDLRASVATSVGKASWKQTTYNAGLYWKLRNNLSPVIGINFQHTNSRTQGIPNFWTIGASFGFSIF